MSLSRFPSILILAAALWAQQTGAIHGVLTDNSGGIIPAAVVSVTGNNLTRSAQTQADGTFTISNLPPGQYTVKAAFPGFSPFEKTVTVSSATVEVPIQLTVTADRQEVTVAAEAAGRVSVQPEDNATALVIKDEDLAALPDDPDDLADALQALAGPGAGPNGGSIYIDGFSGGELPPKESIREIRVNQNPFSAEFDRLGFGRIEILTKPGFDRFRGTLGVNDSESTFNSRNPFSTNKPAYSSRMFMGNVGGPINKRASFFFDVNRRQIRGNSLVNAVYLDPVTLEQQNIQTSVVTPFNRTSISPRLDYQLSTNHTLVARFEYERSSRENSGIGGYRLPPPYADMAYNSSGNEQNFTLTETAIVSPRIINETRFQFSRDRNDTFGNLLPQINVAGAFTTGGNNMGTQFNTDRHYELQNNTTVALGSHTVRFGVRLRRNSIQEQSPAGFAGTFSFDGAVAPVLDANNQPVPGETMQILGIEQYRRTLLFQGLGYSPGQIRQLGGMPSQFSIRAGNPYGSIVRWDAAPWVLDDWRIRSNLTLSLGLRYETQTLLSDRSNIAPRIGFAWSPGAGQGGHRTVIRGGFGLFYDRLSPNLFLQARQLNGNYQLNYVVTDPNFFPTAPPTSSLSATQNSIYSLAPDLRSEYMMQSAIGIERQIFANTTAALTFTDTRAIHGLQTVPINAPLPGTFVPGDPTSGVRPYGDAGNLFEYQSGGLMKQKLLMFNFNTRFRRDISLQGNYTYNIASDLPSTPTDPYDYSVDWGRSSFERRHRLNLVGTAVAPLGIRLSPFVIIQSGGPYDLTLGRDLFGTTNRNARPSFASGPGAGVICRADLGCFDTTPDPTGSFVPRNYLTESGLVSLNMRIGRTFGFGPARGAGAAGGGGFDGHRGGGYRGGGGGGMRMGGGDRGGFGPGGESTEHRYNMTLSLMVVNILNHTNPGGYVGIISSPQFGEPTSVMTGFGGRRGGGAANNRRLELSMRFNF